MPGINHRSSNIERTGGFELKEIILKGLASNLRAALLEDGELVEVFEGDGVQAGLVGNIYQGRVENVLPGMQAAFVDIGLERNAFLYVGDAVPPRTLEEEERQAAPESIRVENVLKSRQELLVQIIKEPVGNKGARITTNLTVAGRHVVLVPNVDHVGVSRKIVEGAERERLRQLANVIRPKGIGLIIRTLAAGIRAEEMREDVEELMELWADIQEKVSHVAVPGIVRREVDLIARLVRDLMDPDIARLTADDADVAATLRSALQNIGHPAANQVFVDMRGDLFERLGVDDEIRKALRPKVWLKSGGYLVVNRTEALVAIDVNTGKYIGKSSLQETVLHTNLEAAREIARQLRLRNLGGIIIVDFIDMFSETDKEQVLKTLSDACVGDRLKCEVLGLTQLGLIEMTRKKSGQALAARYTRPCSACDGAGYLTNQF